MYIITYNEKGINGVYLQIQRILDYLCRNVSKTISVPVYLCRVEALRKILTPQVQQVSSPLLAILRAFERKKKKAVLRARTLGRNGLWDLDGPIWTGTVNKKTRADPENVVYVCTYSYIYIYIYTIM